MTIDEKPYLVLRPKKAPAIWLLFGCAMFVAVGIWMAQEEGWIGYVFAGFFALGIPVAIMKLLPGTTYLEIDEDRLSFASMYRVTTIPWNVIDGFFVISIRRYKMVALNFVPSYDRSRIGRRISSAIVACEAALPDTYGRKAEELADFLNRCLVQFHKRQDKTCSAPRIRERS